VHERVEQLYDLGVLARELPIDLANLVLMALVVLGQRREPLWMLDVLCYHIQDLDLVVGGYLVAWCALLDLQGHVGILVLHVLGQPHRGELAPAELLHDDVSIDEYLAQVHRMIATHLIFLDAFIFAIII